jgi:hypothetical protein
MITYIHMNLVVITLILTAMIFLFLAAQADLGPVVLKINGGYPSLQNSFWFFFAVFSLFLVEYVLLYINNKGISEFWHPVLHVTNTTAGNLASFCMLVAAIAYNRGSKFSLHHAFIYMAGFAFLAVVWASAFEYLGHASAFAIAMETAPVVLLASVSGTALGWVFFARWQGTAWPFLVICILYSLFQFPAYVRGELAFLKTCVDATHCLGPSIKNSNLDLAYAVLASGKVLLAFGFLSLLCSSDQEALEINSPKSWPTKTVPAPHSSAVRWSSALLATIVIAVVTDPLSSAIRELLGW